MVTLPILGGAMSLTGTRKNVAIGALEGGGDGEPTEDEVKSVKTARPPSSLRLSVPLHRNLQEDRKEGEGDAPLLSLVATVLLVNDRLASEDLQRARCIT
jgi:hypothetical protein